MSRTRHSSLARLSTIAVLAATVSGCSGIQSALAPAGPHAELIAELWWVMAVVATAVTVLVVWLLLLGLYRGAGRGAAPLGTRRSRNLVIGGGIILPIVVAVPFIASSFSIGQAIEAKPPADALTVEVEGRLWWWEVHYLDQRGRRIATTANEIHVPVGRPVRFLLTSDNVIHSFWVPNLQGKTDMIPGRVNTSWLVAAEPGIYRGQCAEFCGVQHALMAFMVVASPPEEFAQWLQHQQRPATEPVTTRQQRGLQVFLEAGCGECHAVRGTPADGDVGPDLTHIGGRLSLAAATVPNRRGYLGGWIADPQHVKPGNQMPPTELPSDDLKALLSYLESLE